MAAERFGVHRSNGQTTEYSTRAQAERIARLWGGHVVHFVDGKWVNVEDGETDGN